MPIDSDDILDEYDILHHIFAKQYSLLSDPDRELIKRMINLLAFVNSLENVKRTIISEFENQSEK